LAEEALRWSDQTYLWRPRIMFDEVDHPRNLLSKLHRYPKIHNVVNSLTHRRDFVRACLDLWTKGARFGSYNIVNPGALSTEQIVRCSQQYGLRTALPALWSSDEEFYRTIKAPRASCILDNFKLTNAGIQLRPVQEAIKDSLANWRAPIQNHSNSLMNSPAVRPVQ
jgi:dTDP-4-dehydrorhamnose reductase